MYLRQLKHDKRSRRYSWSVSSSCLRTVVLAKNIKNSDHFDQRNIHMEFITARRSRTIPLAPELEKKT